MPSSFAGLHAVLLATGTDYVPVFHLGAVGGTRRRSGTSATNSATPTMLVVKPEDGASLARALGAELDGADESPWRHRRRHKSARIDVPHRVRLRDALAEPSHECHGHVDHLSPGEIALSAAHSVRPPDQSRWDYWVRQVEKAGLMPAKVAPKRKAAKKSKAKKRR